MRSFVAIVAACGASAYQPLPQPSSRPVPTTARHTAVTASAAPDSTISTSSKTGIGYWNEKVRKLDGWFEGAAASAAAPSSELLTQSREAAAAALPTISFPGRKDEPFRRCDLSSLQAAQIVPARGCEVAKASAALSASLEEDVTVGMRLVLVDGVVSSELSDLSALPLGITASSVADASGAAREGALEALQGALPESDATRNTALGIYGFAALNQACLVDVATVHVGAGVVVEQPLHVVMLSTGDDGDEAKLAASHPNLLVSLGEGASLKLAQQYWACDANAPYFCNGVTRVQVGAGARLEHSYVQEQGPSATHVDSVLVEIDADAEYHSTMLMSGGRIARVNHRVHLNGPKAHSNLRAFSMASESQLCDVHSRVVHVSPECTSQQEQRNAVAGRSRVVWKGAVVVPRGSDGTSAQQLCRTLLLSDDARIDVSPTLEIDTDDVECTHGATISDLDDEMVFYLQARGLSRPDARALLLSGWARDALAGVASENVKVRATARAAALSPDKEVRRTSLSSI